MKIRTRLLFSTIPALLIFIIFIMVIVTISIKMYGMKNISDYKAREIEKEQEKLKDLIEVALKIVDSYYINYAKGLISLNDAKKLSVDNLRYIRYANNKGYFWVINTELPYPKMILYPLNPLLEGKTLDDKKYDIYDGKIKNIFSNMVDTCLNWDSGFLKFKWIKPQDEAMEDKLLLAYVKHYQQFDWIIGTGIYLDEIEQKVERQKREIEDHINIIILRIIIISFIATLFYGLVILIVANNISNPIKKIAKHSTIVSEGNLYKFEYNKKDKSEIGKLTNEFNRLIENFANSIQNIQKILIRLDVVSSENREIAMNLINITSNQVASFEEISSAIEQSSATIKSISENTKKSSYSLIEGASVAEEGFTLLNEIIKSIDNISQQSQNIKKAVELIYSITERTNLLALNASIEAAKAGELGKGFSVVAQEIRKLADKSKVAANEITERIDENNTIVQKANTIIKNSQEKFNKILQSTTTSGRVIKEISSAVNEQAIGTQEIVSSINNIYQMTQKVMEIVENVKITGDTIDEVTKTLNILINNFKIR